MAHDKVWCVVTRRDDEVIVWDDRHGLTKYLEGQPVCGHNIIGFDAPVLERVWNVHMDGVLLDTLVLSRLLNPNVEGGHSLKAWGQRLTNYKDDFTDFDGGLTEEMVEYCKQDVNVTVHLYNHLMKQFEYWGEWSQCVNLEHQTAIQIARQERNGFMLDCRLAMDLLHDMNNEMSRITETLQEKFPPIVEERWSEKTGKRLKDKVTEFNVGSRKQIAERLEGLGVKFKKKTEKGSIIVDEKVLAEIDLPEAKLISRYLMLQKRVGMISSWLDHVKDDGRVHGRVISNGAVTGRMTHSGPNMGQITSVKSEYGKESRSCWTVPDGKRLVGCDLSGIELRCLAHYMQDEDYTRELLDGDIHTVNQEAAGLPTRDHAKTFIYALLYGAGAAKIGAIVGGSERKGSQLINKFKDNMPALTKLMEKVGRLAQKGYVKGLDGRHVLVRHQHAALNTLLQSCGAIIAKQWCVTMHQMFEQESLLVKQVAFVHDEIQVECYEQDSAKVAGIMVDAARIAGEQLGFRVPVDAQAKIGMSWYDTH